MERRRCLRNDVELDAVHQRLVVDRSRVRGARPERLEIPFTRSTYVGSCDTRERDHLHRIDFDPYRAGNVLTAYLDLWPLPEPERQRDASRGDSVAQLGAELHALRLGDAAPLALAEPCRIGHH